MSEKVGYTKDSYKLDILSEELIKYKEVVFKLTQENEKLKEKNKMLNREKLYKLDDEMITEEYINELTEENKRLSKMTCPKCGEELLNPTGADLYDEINNLKEQVAVLQSYKDVNEDFQKAWQELKEENDKIQGLYQDEHCMNLELGKIIQCKTGTIATLANTRDRLKEENEELKKENEEINSRMSDVIYRATGGRLCYSTYTLDAIEHAFQDQLEILSDRKTEELEKEYEELHIKYISCKTANAAIQEENERLKHLEKSYNDLINRVCLENYERLEHENEYLRRALEEIREIFEKQFAVKVIQDKGNCPMLYYSDYYNREKQILDKINEVLKED